jgi:tRNA U55 pseudouridine synthase TruB
LERTAIGEFRVQNAVVLDELTSDTVGERMLPARAAVAQMTSVTLSAAHVLELRNGRPILKSWLSGLAAAETSIGYEIAGVDDAGQLVTIVHEKRPGELWPVHNFSGSR